MFKKIFTLFALSASVVLVGCTDAELNTSNNEQLQTIIGTLSQSENAMLKKVYNDSYLSYYPKTLSELQRVRKPFGKPEVIRLDTEVPFCDVISEVIDDENKKIEDGFQPNSSWMLSQQWYAKYGYTLREQCAMSGSTVIDTQPTSKEVREQVINDTVTINKVTYLSPDLVSKLRESVQDCNRAKIKLIDITDENPKLTVEHYESVQQEILRCEMFKLETDLQK